MINKEQAEHYVWGAGCDGWHLLKNAQLSVIHERMSPGAYETHHFHRESRQFFFVLSGTATFEIGGQREIVHTHEGVEIPPGVPHHMFNETDADIEVLVISQPPSHDDRVLVIP